MWKSYFKFLVQPLDGHFPIWRKRLISKHLNLTSCTIFQYLISWVDVGCQRNWNGWFDFALEWFTSTQKEESEINREFRSSLINNSLQLHSCSLAQMNVKSRKVATFKKDIMYRWSCCWLEILNMNIVMDLVLSSLPGSEKASQLCWVYISLRLWGWGTKFWTQFWHIVIKGG